MTEFDIVMITKNSVKPCLEESLKSIEEAVNNSNFKPRLIIIDGYSTDETLKVIENHVELNPKIIFDDGNRATARQKGVEYVSSEFFAFIDSDVVLTPQWFSKMILHFKDPEVGAVWGAAIQNAEKKRKYFEAMAKFYGKTPTDMMKQYGENRGCLHDTMIRTEAIRGIEIPSEFHVMEDHFVRSFIEKKGWKWISTDDPYVNHHMGEDKPINAFMDAYYGWKLGVYNRRWYIKHIFFSWAKLGYLLIATRDFDVVKSEAVKEWQFLKASLKILWEAIF